MHSPPPTTTTLLLLLSLSGCSQDLVATDNGDAGPDILPITTEISDDDFITSVDATDRMAWRYFDLESSSEVFPAVAGDSIEWDLAFQRFRIQTNGGSSGIGGTEVAIVRERPFEEVTSAPVAPYVQDALDGDDENTDPDFAFLAGEGWYSYDEGSHILSPRPIVFVIRTPESRFFKVQVLDYYDQSGTSGHLTFRWAEIQPPTVALQSSHSLLQPKRIAATIRDLS
jgi:hypothetical protein